MDKKKVLQQIKKACAKSAIKIITKRKFFHEFESNRTCVNLKEN
jgi:hypothetical protein